MRLSSRSYPHPVLGNRDDVPNAAFQAVIEMTSDREFVYIEAEVASSCDTLNSMIDKGDAEFVLHVECSNTMFRQAYSFSDISHRVSIPATELNGAVEVNVFAQALRRISPYTVPEAHSDYGDTAFDIRKGDILAVAEGRIFDVESHFDSFKPVGSIMQISESSLNGDIPLNIHFNADKIVIFLSKKDFADYKVLKFTENVLGPLTTSIVFPVLIEALHLLKQVDSHNGLDDNRRWVRILTRRLNDLNLNDKHPFEQAQFLLELPIRRALSASRKLAESAS